MKKAQRKKPDSKRPEAKEQRTETRVTPELRRHLLERANDVNFAEYLCADIVQKFLYRSPIAAGAQRRLVNFGGVRRRYQAIVIQLLALRRSESDLHRRVQANPEDAEAIIRDWFSAPGSSLVAEFGKQIHNDEAAALLVSELLEKLQRYIFTAIDQADFSVPLRLGADADGSIDLPPGLVRPLALEWTANKDQLRAFLLAFFARWLKNTHSHSLHYKRSLVFMLAAEGTTCRKQLLTELQAVNAVPKKLTKKQQETELAWIGQCLSRDARRSIRGYTPFGRQPAVTQTIP